MAKSAIERLVGLVGTCVEGMDAVVGGGGGMGLLLLVHHGIGRPERAT